MAAADQDFCVRIPVEIVLGLILARGDKKMKRKVFYLLTAMTIATFNILPVHAEERDVTVTAQTYVADIGQVVKTFTIEGVSEEDAVKILPEDFIIEGDYIDNLNLNRTQSTEDVTAVTYENGKLILTVDEFRYVGEKDFVVTYIGNVDENLSFTRSQLASVSTEIADDFVAGENDKIHYRIYIPENITEPVPMVVFTHGGGENGTDNWNHLVYYRGATAWVEYDPNIVVLAPQNVDGWSEEECEGIGEVIRQLIEDGIVDPNRVYGNGLSFGGYGCILSAAHNKELYTAILPMCPTMNDASISALGELADMPIWIATAFEDHTANRDDMIVACMTMLKAMGNEEAHYILYQAEEFLKYNLGLTEDMLPTEYHWSWVLTLNNEYKLMDWLFSQTK